MEEIPDCSKAKLSGGAEYANRLPGSKMGGLFCFRNVFGLNGTFFHATLLK
jgi:hypothetical protein